MVKNYILKNEISSPRKIQRLLKTIDTNVKQDRSAAQSLLKKVTTALDEYLANPPINPENPEETQGIGDSFYKLIQSAVLALNQAGVANERLLKLASLLNKINSDSSKKNPIDDKLELSKSLFSNIEKLANNEEDD